MATLDDFYPPVQSGSTYEGLPWKVPTVKPTYTKQAGAMEVGTGGGADYPTIEAAWGAGHRNLFLQSETHAITTADLPVLRTDDVHVRGADGAILEWNTFRFQLDAAGSKSAQYTNPINVQMAFGSNVLTADSGFSVMSAGDVVEVRTGDGDDGCKYHIKVVSVDSDLQVTLEEPVPFDAFRVAGWSYHPADNFHWENIILENFEAYQTGGTTGWLGWNAINIAPVKMVFNDIKCTNNQYSPLSSRLGSRCEFNRCEFRALANTPWSGNWRPAENSIFRDCIFEYMQDNYGNDDKYYIRCQFLGRPLGGGNNDFEEGHNYQDCYFEYPTVNEVIQLGDQRFPTSNHNPTYPDGVASAAMDSSIKQTTLAGQAAGYNYETGGMLRISHFAGILMFDPVAPSIGDVSNNFTVNNNGEITSLTDYTGKTLIFTWSV